MGGRSSKPSCPSRDPQPDFPTIYRACAKNECGILNWSDANPRNDSDPAKSDRIKFEMEGLYEVPRSWIFIYRGRVQSDVSAVRIPSGWKVTFFDSTPDSKRENIRLGQSTTLEGDHHCLVHQKMNNGDWYDKPVYAIVDKPGGRPRIYFLRPWLDDLKDLNDEWQRNMDMIETVYAIYVPSGWKVEVYDQINLSGNKFEFTASVANIRTQLPSWYGRIRSLKVVNLNIVRPRPPDCLTVNRPNTASKMVYYADYSYDVRNDNNLNKNTGKYCSRIDCENQCLADALCNYTKFNEDTKQCFMFNAVLPTEDARKPNESLSDKEVR